MIWTLRKKIFIGYGMALALMIVVLVWAFVNLLSLGHAGDAILRENCKSIFAAENMINALEQQDSATLLVILGYEDDGLRKYHENEIQFLQWLGRAKDNITVEGEDKVISIINTGYSSYLVSFSELRLLYQADPKKAAAFYHETVSRSFESVHEACVRLREINQEAMFKAGDRAKYIAGRVLWSMVIIGVAAVGIVLGFSLLLSHLLTRPLRQIMEATQKITDGNYDVEISTDSSDELGRLAGEFNTMAKKLKTYHDLNIEQIVAEKRKSDAIIQSIDDGIVVVDAEFRVTDMNPIAAEAFGVELDKGQCKYFWEVVKSEQLFNYVKQSAESGQSPSIDQNVFTVQKGETQRHYQFSITPVFASLTDAKGLRFGSLTPPTPPTEGGDIAKGLQHAKAGSMLEVVLLLRDVTRLKELDRLKSEFVTTASHELRTPLTSIGMSIDLLLEKTMEKLSEKERQLLSVAHEEIQRLKALVNNLLDLSKIEAGKMEMEFDRVPVRILCEKAVAVLKAQADEKSVELSFELPEELPDVKADANKITWVLTNLISNALRYTDCGGHIRLFAEHAGPQVHISVSDDGAGIPYEYQSKIFDKFVQVKSDKNVGGSGLGLAICKEIVHAHRGTIWVDSTSGEGSTFTFTLPVVE